MILRKPVSTPDADMDTASPLTPNLDQLLYTLQMDSRLQTLEHKALTLRHTLRKMTAITNLRAEADGTDAEEADDLSLLPSEAPVTLHSARLVTCTRITVRPRLIDVSAPSRTSISPSRSSVTSSVASSDAGSSRRVPGPRSSTSSATSYSSLATDRSYSDWRAARTCSAAFPEREDVVAAKESKVVRRRSVIGTYLGRLRL